MVRSASCVAVSLLAAGTIAIAGCSSAPPAATRTASSVLSTSGTSATSSTSPTTPPTSTSSGRGTTAYVARVQWVPDARGRSLHVYPTAVARSTRDPAARTIAWAQVVRLARAADTATLHDQFDCHWDYARIADPSKTSWNLETWRPVVDAQTMFDTRCNPGGAEE